MSIERTKEHMKKWGMDDRVLEFETSSATVELAAQAVGCEPARIAKTLSFKIGEEPILIVTAGDAKIDNHNKRNRFRLKQRCSPLMKWRKKWGTPWAVYARLALMKG